MNAPAFMKNSLQLATLLLALLFTAATASAIPGRAEVKKVVGKATVTNAKNATSSITEGMVLGTGDTITTGAGSYVDLFLGLNGDFLRVDADSTLKIDNLDIGNVAQRTVTTQLDVQKGQIVGNVVAKLTAASKYEIKTASGVAGIRGTKYMVRRDASNNVTRIVCTEGTVTFVDRGVTITIGANKAYTPPAAAPSQAAVGAPNLPEVSLVNMIVAQLEKVGQTSISTSTINTTTIANNPADTSTSVK